MYYNILTKCIFISLFKIQYVKCIMHQYCNITNKVIEDSVHSFGHSSRNSPPGSNLQCKAKRESICFLSRLVLCDNSWTEVVLSCDQICFICVTPKRSSNVSRPVACVSFSEQKQRYDRASLTALQKQETTCSLFLCVHVIWGLCCGRSLLVAPRCLCQKCIEDVVVSELQYVCANHVCVCVSSLFCTVLFMHTHAHAWTALWKTGQSFHLKSIRGDWPGGDGGGGGLPNYQTTLLQHKLKPKKKARGWEAG